MALTRRGFLEASAVTALGTLWTPGDRPAPPDFPPEVPVERAPYRNWAGEIQADGVWTCTPRTAADVVTVTNWAYRNGYSVRARGYRHTWAPLTVPADGAADRTILVDTTRHLTSMAVLSTAPAAVRVQAGASMDDFLAFLEEHGLGVTNTPAPGDLSVGGVLAINGHGTSVPADGETLAPGHTYGSLSNLILSLTAVVWDAAAGGYALRTFDRSDPDCTALLAHVGRAFVTEVTMRVGANQNLRCVSRVDIPAPELFAAPGTGGRTLASHVAAAGRVEAIWFAFTDNPWLKVWSVSPTRPLTSRPVVTPYNYVFSDNVPEPVSELAEQLLTGAWALTPTFGQVQYTTAAAGLTGTLATDLWGPSKNLLLYVKPTTLRETANGYAVHTNRGSIQRVVHEFARFYQRQLAGYQARGEFPVTGQVEIRVAGLDRAADVGVPGAEPPALSAARPRADHPEWDTVVWFDVLTFPTAPRAHAFYREMEIFFFTNYTGSYAGSRVEWSKGWGYTDSAAWADPTMLTRTVPDSYRHAPDPTWDRAVAELNGYDPHRVFSNAFLDVLLPGTP
ncbi:cholesterol oxidase substrate-binding domain-containing protein [Plantactinospora sp. KLBMP9567]|uniref:cholesterol oxidase substrate-binding domain-containing protein n=1 Tax=Plantactinospora sp. KLBMP9567 TaxID=3085900 RepID=UPI002981DB9E|nr:cholesterol oxidase substrate-binding domain-containing protein [Plantactinospora sp. KLBMP9567]MDW5322758.1 cholesterol oxidase substrate-binding domain-containing protein [Plantactinospora sp. KLBMP9567]